MCTFTSTWTPGIDSPSPNSPRRRSSTASFLMRISVTRTTPMRKRSGRPLGARPWGTTAFRGTPYSRRQALSYSCLQTTTSICSLRRGCEEASKRPQSATPEQTISWSRGTTQGSQVATSYTSIRTISTVGL